MPPAAFILIDPLRSLSLSCNYMTQHNATADTEYLFYLVLMGGHLCQDEMNRTKIFFLNIFFKKWVPIIKPLKRMTPEEGWSGVEWREEKTLIGYHLPLLAIHQTLLLLRGFNLSL